MAAAPMPVLSRIVAAIVGGFGFTSAVIIALPLLLPGSRVQAVLWATLGGFAVWTAAAVWVFAARSATRAWAGLVLASLPPLAVILLLGDTP
ncbi:MULTISPECIES: DUF3649 domain-containing protein [unclassified Pseudomonas]|uniref:DUF3649 domain-containing protein n=1 Tax=unclassified Pseudomonas TaxID=196821 RepID=UPI00244B7A3E|nr:MULTISPECIES: DUF3649 domain-containing protein [unclassified Pseudomonas]MDG9926621.1 DUF3649 domain-containing protein [Pseudomonas sp. GD04042]MDH0482310.1 DUF3649 domain-containing protein [Pseudomonas sp. GD04015]MDH0603745.1 DUF3649 domain-containing protein [Pseudomonas sp. GD03869]